MPSVGRLRFWRRRKPSAREDRDLWLKAMLANGHSVKTIEGYKITTDKLLRRYPGIRLNKITDAHIVEIIEEHAPGSRQRARSPFTTWFRWAYRTRRIKHDPMGRVPTYRQGDQERPEVFTEAECAVLGSLPHPDGALMALLLGTGLRKSEARNLRLSRVDFDDLQLHVVEGAKGGHSRIVPLVEPGLVQKLAEYVLLEGLNLDDYVWYSHPGGSIMRSHRQPLSESAMHKWWTRCMDVCGVPYRNLHATRHTFATQWRRRGLTIDDTGRALGHRDLKTTYRVYDQTSVFDLARKMEALL